MLRSISPEPLLTDPTHKRDESLLNVVTYLDQANLILQDGFTDISSEKEKLISSPQCSETKQGSIFVCTFCQVFSTSNSAIANHISKHHSHSLKEGTVPENYVSKLQALKSDAGEGLRRVGRPRKTVKTSPSVSIEKNSASNPVLGPDGLYWCRKCHRHFKKPRQHSRHVCLENYSEDELVDESEIDCDDTADFKSYMNVQPVPWSKLKKRKTNDVENAQNSESFSDKTVDERNVNFQANTVKVVPNWRDDPSYVPLFKNDYEKEAFENHLKSIDYSCVDSLFDKIEKKPKVQRNKNCTQTAGAKYSCVICKKVVNNLSHIRLHCLIHTDLKPFTCPKCPYRSNVKGSLYTHMRTHTGNVFCCCQCNFQTTKRSRLLDHEQTHSVVRQCCRLCKNTYKTAKSLLFHVKRYHNNANGKKYIKFLTSSKFFKILAKCSICDKNFPSQSKLVAHKRNSHPVISTSEVLVNQKLTEKEPENSSESVHSASLQNIPSLLDCSVRIEPLDDQLFNYLYSIKCNICNQKFASQSMLENHRLLVHTEVITSEHLENQEVVEKIPENAFEDINFTDPHVLSSLLECSVRIKPLDGQLVEIMLNNLLQQKNSQPGELFDVFQHSPPSNLLTSSNILNKTLSPESTAEKLMPMNDINQFHLANASILEECQQKLHIDILDECLRHSNITEEVIADTSYQTSESNMSSERHQQPSPFDLPGMGLNFLNNQLMSETISGSSNILPKDMLQLGSELSEQKPEEIKLFEKCRRAPAYVCCVCSGIFICPSTLKAHLKEHVNKNSDSNNFMEHPVEKFESTKLTDSTSSLDDVCRILQGSSSSDVENELEKLYTSSLHRMWYLPEVSVVLENDQSLIDAVLDDISNFPINDVGSENLQLDSEIFS